MEWWVWVLVAVGAYLALCVLPWIGLAFVSSVRNKRGAFVTEVMPRISALVDAERIHAGLWPETARAGRYGVIDQRASELLAGLSSRLSDINEQADEVAAYAVPELPLWRVLILGAWGPLFAAIRALSDQRRLDATIEVAERLAGSLLEQQTLAESVPDRAQADLAEVRAEVRRLYALWEAEVQAGTKNIQALGDGLALVDNAMGSAGEAVRTAEADDAIQSIVHADQQLAMAQETVQQADKDLSAIRESRAQAQQSAEGALGKVKEVQERWAALMTKGAHDPSVAARLAQLSEGATSLNSLLAEATPAAYASAAQQAGDLDALGATITGELQALDEILEKSNGALAANRGVLEQAQAALVAAQSDLPALEFDEASAGLTDAQEVITQAEGLQQEGTWHGYQSAITLSTQASAALDTVLAGLEQARGVAASLAAQRGEVDDAARQGLRERAAALAEHWQEYARHWHPLRQEALSDALGHLSEADAAWAALPEGYLANGAVAQSGLAEVQAGMKATVASYAQARQGVDLLEQELVHIRSLRDQLETGLAALEGTTLPALQARSSTMLPELVERYETWLTAFQAERSGLSSPAEIDYERAAGQWLPETTAEAHAILSAYAGDLAHYGRLLEDAKKRLEREWQRLQRTDPTKKPLPAEDIERLTADFQTWSADIENDKDSPAALAPLVTHQASDLEQRIEAARTQITEGRGVLTTLDRQFDQLSQSIQKARSSIRTLLHDNQWQQINWTVGSGEEVWERAMAAQASSRSAEALDVAIDEIRRALSVGQEAQQVYVGTEQHLRSALDRLNREFRSATGDLDRAQRRAAQLRQQGPSDQLDALDERISQAMSSVSMAQNATSFEDALRYLRESQETISRD